MEWKPTACILCYVNCGLEVAVEGRDVVAVHGDRQSPRSRGYLCQKAQRIGYYGNHRDRLTSPLRRRDDGTFEEVSWEVALGEIAARLLAIKAAHGAPALAFYGGGGQGNHLGGAYFGALRAALGATKVFSALAQEKTGDFWVNGRLFGHQTCHTSEDIEHADLLVVIGCNPYLAHGFQQARAVLNAFRKDPAKKLIVIDPRRTETAEVADLHLAVRPGTDAFLLAALLAMIVRRGGQAEAFLRDHTVGFEEVRAALLAVPIDAWVDASGVSMADAERAVELILAARAMSVRVELGVQQSRHSTLNSYLEKLLYLVTGHFGRRGTNNLHSFLTPLFGHSPGQKSAVTGQEIIAGLMPPNRFAEEVLAEHPERIRAVWVDSNNPANTAADTTRVEAALRALELLVVVDVALTETAALAHYVLPAASQYEKWECTFFTLDWPQNTIQLREPLFEPLNGTLPEPEIYARLLRAMGILPSAEELAPLAALAREDRAALMPAAMAAFASRPELAKIGAVLLYETLGKSLPDGAAAAAPLYVSCHRTASTHPDAVRRALGSDADGPALGELLFDRLLASRHGMVFTDHQPEDALGLLRHRDRKVHLAVPELLTWLRELDPRSTVQDPEFPFIVVAGQRRMHNANQIFRTPAWRKSDPDGALRLHPDDLAAAGGADGGWLAVVTRAGRLVVRAEADASFRRGVGALPHGYGQSFPDGEGGRVVDGPRLNVITSAEDRDPIAATPYHKNVAARLETVSAAEVEAAEARARRVRAVAGA
jgi:anaerobic selenocysteine-containing dehydrogenase